MYIPHNPSRHYSSRRRCCCCLLPATRHLLPVTCYLLPHATPRRHACPILTRCGHMLQCQCQCQCTRRRRCLGPSVDSRVSNLAERRRTLTLTPQTRGPRIVIKAEHEDAAGTGRAADKGLRGRIRGRRNLKKHPETIGGSNFDSRQVEGPEVEGQCTRCTLVIRPIVYVPCLVEGEGCHIPRNTNHGHSRFAGRTASAQC